MFFVALMGCGVQDPTENNEMPSPITSAPGLAAKWTYVTRRVHRPEECDIGPHSGLPAVGDLVVAQVREVDQHRCVEDPHGRRVRLYPGDLVVGAYGNRYATDFYEGYLPEGPMVHLLTAGGLLGRVFSAREDRGQPTVLEVLGRLIDAAGRPLSTGDFGRPRPPAASPALGTVAVVGSAMNAGKTTTAASIVRGLRGAGIAVGAAKVTGSGSGKDHWSYVDAGAVAVVDFLDFGLPSTFGVSGAELASLPADMRAALAVAGCEVAVLEVADGLLHTETADLVPVLAPLVDAFVLAVPDPLAGLAGVSWLRDRGIEVAAVSGLVTRSPLAVRELEAATGVPAFSPAQLADREALSLLAAAAPVL